MLIPVLASFAAFAWLLCLLREDRMSLGLPFAYLVSVFVQYLPGAFVDWAQGDDSAKLFYTKIGTEIMAVGVVSFVIGAWLARRQDMQAPSISPTNDGMKYWLFCLFGGLFMILGVYRFVADVPTLGNAILLNRLGVDIRHDDGPSGCDAAQKLQTPGILDRRPVVLPDLYAGECRLLSVGSASVIIVVCLFAITARKLWRVFATIIYRHLLRAHAVRNYFQARDHIRDVAWSGNSGFAQRATPCSISSGTSSLTILPMSW